MPTLCSYYHNAFDLARHHRLRLIPVLMVVVFFSLAAYEASAQMASSTSGSTSESLGGSFREEQPRGVVMVQGGDAADPIVNAIDEYRRTGNARTINQSNFVAYPFGHSQPTLTCAPLRACVIELETGEVVMAVIAGDTERWLIDQAFTGLGGDTPLVVIKPTAYDLTTNLVVSTDRRIYELTLDSPPQPKKRRGQEQNPQALYTRRIKFYYPDDMVRTLAEREAGLRRAATETVPLNPDFNLENLNFNYHWSQSKGFPFQPEQVFDDGAHTYIKLPASARHDAAPVLFILDDGERQILNYTVRAVGEHHHYYITDRAFRHGLLVLGTRKKNWRGKEKHSEETLHIWNQNRD